MRGALVLRPILDTLAPEEAAAGRRVRNTAIWLALAAWLLPEYHALGTGTTAHRAIICGAFVAAAVAAQFRHRYRWARVLLPVASCAAAAVVAWFGHGAMWGLAFVVFAVLVVAGGPALRRALPLPPAEEEFDPLPPRAGGIPSVLSALAWIGISILFMMEWAGQAMVVPTGSMQPTIMGARPPRASGDHLFVDNFSFLFRDPRRFEIVVFEFPLFRNLYYVKRVVGLPGEHVEIRDGDIWVDGKVAKKPPVVQQSLWRELYPRPNFLASAKTIRSFQQVIGSTGTWKQVSETETRCVPGKEASFAWFDGSGVYPDVRLVFMAVREAGASVVAQITTRGTPVTLTLPDTGAATLAVGKQSAPFAAPAGPFLRVEFCVADGEAWVLVDGSEVARAAVPLDSRGKNRVEIGAAGAAVNFRDVYLGRDIVYTAGDGPAAYDVPPDGFLFLGDNVEGSADSRKWTVEVFHPKGGGAPILGATEYPDEAGNPKGGRIKIEGGSYRFFDVDAVPRELPRDGTTVEHGVRAPFARRSHLVGRAILIFWPWIPAEAGFRPRLIP